MALALPTTGRMPLSNSSSSSSVRSVRPMTSRSSRTSLNTNFVVDWNNPSKNGENGAAKETGANLQDAFRRFRDQRMTELRLEQRVAHAKKKKIRRSDPERMRRLRIKFVEQAKKYLGVPYARKYFEPGTPEYESKLYLDCCGLVRRVMYDLSKEFGFVIGPWNQSYMFDTLPKTITDLSKVQPGDLVFIAATYYNPKMKKQRHNLTHVEIMLGDGEKTIGARWNNGKVQFFDSYKFISKSYHSQIYTIKSLEPWLRGICKSYCPEHSWYRRGAKKKSKKSIFYLDESSNSEHRHHRRHRSKTAKGAAASESSSSSLNSSTKKSRHRRKHKKKSNRSTSVPLNNEETSIPVQSVEDLPENSGDEEQEEEEELVNRLATINCEDEQEQPSDDSDSMDEALDAELLEDENDNTLDLCETKAETQ